MGLSGFHSYVNRVEVRRRVAIATVESGIRSFTSVKKLAEIDK